jgi:hypothetical protein
MEMHCILFEARAEILDVIYINLVFHGVNDLFNKVSMSHADEWTFTTIMYSVIAN